MAKCSKRPAWFKMFLHQKAIIDSVDDATAGKALKAVFQYFDTGETVDLDQMAFIVFSAIKPYIDESFLDFQRSSEAGKKGMKNRWGKEDNPLKDPITPYNEAEAEAEAEADTEADADAAVVVVPAAAATDRKLEIIGGKLGKGVVALSDAQMEKLIDIMGLDMYELYTEKLATFILRNDAKGIKSHYETILDWWQKDCDKGGTA